MIKKILFMVLPGLLLVLGSQAVADRLDDKIRAAGSDIKVFCPATDANNIQWAALLYLNQTYGAEIYVALFQPSPTFGFETQASDDGQFHLAQVGLGVNTDRTVLVDSIIARIFHGTYPDIALFEAETPEDSVWLASTLTTIRLLSQNDSTALTTLDRIYVRGWGNENSAVLFNDEELYARYHNRAEEISKNFYPNGPLNYSPDRFRRYYLLTPPATGQSAAIDLVSGSGLDVLRLPGIIERRLPDGPERKNILRRLDSYISSVGMAGRPWLSRSEKLRPLMTAYADITALADLAHDENGHLAPAGVGGAIEELRQKVFLAIEEAIGIDWRGNFEVRETPFGKSGKLSLDLAVLGPREVELSFFKFHPSPDRTVVIDSISKIIEPHQRFYREYPVDLERLDFAGITHDSLMFSLDVVVEGLTLNLRVPFSDYAQENLGLRFLPGYTFLEPFTADQFTALAQPFDWQLLITKPYGSILDGRIKIDNPDGIVVGTFDDHIFMPEGITAKYMDIHFAAGRSVGYDLRTVRALLEVGGVTVAQTSAEVRVVRCEIPDTRDIAFIPDPEGRLEDFLRITRASITPFTPRGLIRAPLEAYDVLVIGSDAVSYYDVLGKVGDRLHEFVRNGGDILILGQSFGWPHDIFGIPIYTAKSAASVPAKILNSHHAVFTEPYEIDTQQLLANLRESSQAWPAMIGGGTEIISAGELGSYLRVFTIGEGHVIYCGLPLLEMSAALDVEAIHMMANLINFGYGK